MAEYKRIPGGEKTSKSGTAWSEDELREVLSLYIKLDGKGLHEHNPEIQSLAARLGRSVRSTEAQTLMFRNLARGGDYSHGNMNKLCRDLWEERMSEMEHDNTDTPEEKLFPNAFFSWSGSSDGAVKRPFEVDEKRLIGPIQTRVIERLNAWAENVVAGFTCPRSVFLVGGPGNGKTDAVEGTIRQLGVLLGCPDEIENHFRTEYGKYLDRGVLPRKVVLIKKIGRYDGVHLVQDATVRDSQFPDKTPQELLLNDLEEIVLNASSRQLYICCVNRGVLAESISIAADGEHRVGTVDFLNQVSYAVTSHPDAVDAWPLTEYRDVAIWPMDVESLVDPALYENGETPGDRIFNHVVDASRWKDHRNCPAKDHCPFHANHELLSNYKVRGALLELLYAYELVSGKRWNFRELFGLVSATMVGSENEYTGLTPCEWVQKQVEVATGSDNNAACRAAFNLVSKLYMHALFPRWPKLGNIRNQFSQKLKVSGNTFGGQREIVQGFLSALFQRVPDNSSTVSTLLSGVIGEALDPVGYNGNRPINNSGSILMNQVEECFSHSITLGSKTVSRYLVGPEKLLFKYLEQGEGFLENTESFSKNNLQVAKEVHASMKIFSARLFKRSIGVRCGIYQHVDEIALYKQSLCNPQEMVRLKRVFEKLINNDSSFQASLVTTFGQPDPSFSRNALLRSPFVSVKSLSLEMREGRPRLKLPYFKIGSRAIPLTFELYFALHHSSMGLDPASLPEEVFALLDSTKSCVLGEIVRDEDRVDQFDIIVGGLDEIIKYDDVGGFYVEKIGRD
jgi:hypothetical protein